MLLLNGMTYDELVKKVKDMGFANVTDITSRMVCIHVSLENGKKTWEMQPLKTRDDVRALALYMEKGKDIAEYTVKHFEKASGRFYKVSFDEVHSFLETVEKYIKTQEEESRLERKAADIIMNADDLGYPMITNDYYKIKSLLREIESKKYSCSIEINRTDEIRAFGMIKGYDPSITEEVMKTLYEENKINSGMIFVTDYVTIDHDMYINKITLNKVENTFKTIKKQKEAAEAEKKLEKVNDDTTTTTNDAVEEVTDNTVTDDDTTTTTDDAVEEVTDNNNKTTDVTVTNENKVAKKMNTRKEVKIDEKSLEEMLGRIYSFWKKWDENDITYDNSTFPPKEPSVDICYIPETGKFNCECQKYKLYKTDFHKEHSIQVKIEWWRCPIRHKDSITGLIEAIMQVVDPYNPKEEDNAIIEAYKKIYLDDNHVYKKFYVRYEGFKRVGVESEDDLSDGILYSGDNLAEALSIYTDTRKLNKTLVNRCGDTDTYRVSIGFIAGDEYDDYNFCELMEGYDCPWVFDCRYEERDIAQKMLKVEYEHIVQLKEDEVFSSPYKNGVEIYLKGIKSNASGILQKIGELEITKENKEVNKMNTKKEVKINERDFINVTGTINSLKGSPDGWRYDVCYVPKTGALYTGDLHVNNQSWSQFNEDDYIQFPITKIFADSTVHQLKEFIKDVMTVVDPYNPSEDDELLIAGLMWEHLEWPGKRHFKNDVIFKVDGSRVPIGKVEFVLRYVDANKTINRLYVHEAIDGIAPELTVFTLYKRYADNTDELLQVTYDTAKALALKADLDAWRYLQVFKNEEEAKYLALKQHMDAESYLKIFKTEKPKTIDDTSVIRGYRFEFELGSIRMIWDEENRDADGKYLVDVLYKFRGDGYSWHDACSVYLDPDKEELDEDYLYDFCFANVESGNWPLTEERRAEEEATW